MIGEFFFGVVSLKFGIKKLSFGILPYEGTTILNYVVIKLTQICIYTILNFCICNTITLHLLSKVLQYKT